MIQKTGICLVVATSPGSPGNDGTSTKDRSGSASCRGPAGEVPCYDREYGWFSQADGCYYRQVDPQPPADDPVWAGSTRRGRLSGDLPRHPGHRRRFRVVGGSTTRLRRHECDPGPAGKRGGPADATTWARHRDRSGAGQGRAWLACRCGCGRGYPRRPGARTAPPRQFRVCRCRRPRMPSRSPGRWVTGTPWCARARGRRMRTDSVLGRLRPAGTPTPAPRPGNRARPTRSRPRRPGESSGPAAGSEASCSWTGPARSALRIGELQVLVQ